MKRVLSLGVGLVLALGACAGSDGSEAVTSDAAYFTGLDGAVVEEVLDNPRAIANVEILPDDQRPSMWQGMVVNFTFCRQALDVYESWRDSGTTPRTWPDLGEPAQPEASFDDMVKTREFYEGEVRSGDISRLRGALLNESSCGVWIPAEPGDADGPTIADQVRAGG